MALVPCWQCGQPFYASCHDASCIDALCPYCTYAEPAEPATNAPPTATDPPVQRATEATAAPLLPAVSRDSVRAHHPASHPASPSQRGRR
jgi:hypothetical protein